VVLVGHSIGGMTMLTFCRRYPALLGSKVRGSSHRHDLHHARTNDRRCRFPPRAAEARGKGLPSSQSAAVADRVVDELAELPLERHEEPVVAKTARATEEVVVSRDVSERTETVSDTVRETKVEVDRPATQRDSTPNPRTDDKSGPSRRR
jgi:hypothetical protein